MLSVSVTPYRIAQELFRFTSDPRWRFYFADKLDNILYGMVPTFHNVSAESTSLTQDNKIFYKHTFTYRSMASKILDAAEKYSKSS